MARGGRFGTNYYSCASTSGFTPLDKTQTAWPVVGDTRRLFMSMTNRQRILATVLGVPTDQIPWASRLDLWYKANKLADTPPPEYWNASLIELLDDL